MNRLSPAVLGLVIVNAAAFVVGMVMPEARAWLVEHGAIWFTGNPHFALWQVVTYMFLHGGAGHILFNMFGLVSFGGLLERQWGTRRFLIFYFLCGVGAALVHNAVNAYQFGVLQERLIAQGLTPDAIRSLLETGRGTLPPGAEIKATLVELYRIYAGPMLGASGAIYGILVAFGLLYPNAKLALMFLPVPIAAKFFIPILLALDLLSGVTGFSLFGGGIAHFAHLGGALIGFILMLVWRRQAQRDQARREAEGFRPST
ncbi:MAG: rhomboid family intramembrane serine protease [Verrucomicrobia bacterium]|nr:rhomboid family intramembrane serine protease [Verrucomicrobiota bacterium]